MGRRLLALLVAVPVAASGSVAAHELGYHVALSDRGERAEVLASTGHGHLSHGALLAFVALTLLAAGAVLSVHAELRGYATRVGSARPFLLIAPLMFGSQELLERVLQDGRLELATLAEPSFLLGLGLQLPFALLAWLAARLVLRSARALAAVLRRAQRPARKRGLTPAPGATRVRGESGTSARYLRGRPSLLETSSAGSPAGSRGLWIRGHGQRPIARATRVDRKTVRGYGEAAERGGLVRERGEDQLTDELIGLVCEAVRPRRSGGHGAAWSVIAGQRAAIKE